MFSVMKSMKADLKLRGKWTKDGIDPADEAKIMYNSFYGQSEMG